MKKIEAVAFDFDGTLYSFEAIRRPYMLRYWYRVKSIRTYVHARQAMRQEYFSSPEEMLSFQDRWVSERLNITPQKARERFHKLMIQGLAASLKPSRQRFGLEPFLKACVDKGIKIILISENYHKSGYQLRKQDHSHRYYLMFLILGELKIRYICRND